MALNFKDLARDWRMERKERLDQLEESIDAALRSAFDGRRTYKLQVPNANPGYTQFEMDTVADRYRDQDWDRVRLSKAFFSDKIKVVLDWDYNYRW